MEFGLSELQVALQENISKYLAEACSLERVRSFADSGDSYATDVWKGLCELGVAGVVIPETFGGLGMQALDAVVISECLGYSVAPVPFLSSAVVAPYAFMQSENDDLKTHFLPKLASGEIVVGLALSEAKAARGDAGVKLHAGKLRGKALYVTDPDSDYLLVVDQQATLHVVSTAAAGLSFKEMPNIDRTRNLCAVEFEDVVGTLVVNGATDQLVHIARVMVAADTLGASQAMLDMSIEYAMQREQFNRVIASFQAVKHMCAEMAAEIEPARSLVWYAGHALDEMVDEASLTACHAKAHLSEVGTFVAKTATVVHGGMGFTDLLGLHYWFKRIGFNRQFLGGPEVVRDEAANLQGLVA